MANEVGFNFLTDKITGLQIITHELSNMFLSVSDLNQADAIRAQITSLNQVLFAFQSARNSLAAQANEVPPPPAQRIAALQQALQRLDSFVRSDQNIQLAFNFLNSVASSIRNA